MFTSGMQKLISFVLFIFILQGSKRTVVVATCTFPPEYTGEFTMQKSENTKGSLEYGNISISFIGTPLWGNCYKRFDNNFIFKLSNDDSPCLRCLNLNLKSKNVLYVRSSNFSHCFLKEEEAIASCPNENIKDIADIILFKVADVSGYKTEKEFCPLGDKYQVTYNTSKHRSGHCMKREATLTTCGSGAVMNLTFQECENDAFDFRLSCIGDWTDSDGQRYLALEDTRKKPPYRCAQFHENLETGKIHIALSKDSTCNSQLESPTEGFETISLTPILYNEDQKEERQEEINSTDCRFPFWLQSEWAHVKVANNKFFYKDQTDFITYDLKCLTKITQDKYIVYSRTHCTKRAYNCLWIQRRSDDVFEFQLGGRSSKYRTEHLCDPSNMLNKWITQSRKHPISPIKCPISGVFKGVIPDMKSYCTNLSSDCMTPDLMYYKVFNCETMDVIEEREYRCLGHWKEDDLLYTYTKRHDKIAQGTFECFVGSIVSDREDYIIIKEAGEHCQRNMDPLSSGMKLIKQKQLTVLCVGNETSSETTHSYNNNENKPNWPIYETTAQNNLTNQFSDNKNDQKINPQAGASLCILPVVAIYLFSIFIVIIL